MERWIVLGVSLLCLAASAAERPYVQFITDILDQSQNAYSTGMRNLVTEVAKAAGTDDAQNTKLQEAADSAVKMKMTRSEEDLWKVWDEMQVDGKVNQVAYWQVYRTQPNAQITPERLPPWEEGLRAVLNPEQLAKWEVVAAAKRARIDKAVQGCVDKGREAWVAKRKELRLALVDSLAANHQLAPPQADSFRTGVSTLVNDAATRWGAALERLARDYVKTAFIGQADDRLSALEAGSLNFGTEGDEEAVRAEETAWRALVQATLTAEQFQKYAEAEDRRQARRLAAIAQVVVAEVDRKVLLTAAQRAKLEPVVQKIVTTDRARVEALMGQNYVNSEMLLAVINAVNEADVKTILDPEQWAGWKEAASRMAYFLDR
jgi:hypothetical protein